MNRRAFLGNVGAVGSWLVMGATLPKMIGEPAGGFFAAVPDDLEPYLKWHDVLPPNQLIPGKICSLMALWAAPGAEYGELAQWGGYVDNAAAFNGEKHRNLIASLRCFLVESHEPGWLHTRVTMDDGEHSELRWKRCGYLRWLKASELDTMGRDLLIKVA